jgi:hypothetical protein
MRTIAHPNFDDGHHCPICGTKEDKEVILVSIAGTQDGNNCQAIQVHTDCLQEQLVFYPEIGGGMLMLLANK